MHQTALVWVSSGQTREGSLQLSPRPLAGLWRGTEERMSARVAS